MTSFDNNFKYKGCIATDLFYQLPSLGVGTPKKKN